MNDITVKPPADIANADKPRAVQFDLAKKPSLTQERMADLEKQVKKVLEDSRQNTATMRRRLNALNDMLEGVAQEVNYPFPNASNVDVKMAIGTARTIRSTMVRALFSDPERSFIVSIDKEDQRENANIVEDAFNWKAGHENGLIDALKDSIIPIFRDGIAFIQGIWEKRTENVIDYRTYMTVDDFVADYPTAKDAGIDEDTYNEVITAIVAEGAADVCFEHDMVMKDTASFSVVTLPRFYWYPLSAKSLEDCELYGVRMEESEATMRKKAKTKEYMQDAVDDCISQVKEGPSVVDLWDRSRDFVEGISRQSDTKRKDFENFRLVLTIDLDEDGIPEKYMGVFNLAKGRFLNFGRYKIRHNIDFLAPVRFARRDDRLLGHSLMYDGQDLFQEVTDIHRHRNNARFITDSPGFIAEDGLKDSIEQELSNWRPGVVLWVPQGKMAAVKQMELQNRSNTQNSIDEENSLRGYVEFVIGPTQGLSGQETKGDENAPATKHLSKIRQAGFRMDDYIDEFKRTFPQIGKLALALYYQYGGMKLSYRAKDKNGVLSGKEADRSLFGAEGLTMDINARSVIMSPEFEMERVMALAQAVPMIPDPIGQMRVKGELWNRYVAASRTQDPEKLKVDVQTAMAPALAGLGGAAPAPSGAPRPKPNTGGTGGGGLLDLVRGMGGGNPTERARV